MMSARNVPHIPRFRALLLGLAFFSFAVLAACDRQSVPRLDSDVTELSRVTSPNGQLDAVLTQDFYGEPWEGSIQKFTSSERVLQ